MRILVFSLVSTCLIPAVSMAYVPEPQPVRTQYRIGAFYYPGWDSMSEWNRVRRVCPERKPLLGWYDESNPEVVDWQIKWAVENGISYFLVDWYWDCGARRLNHWLEARSKARYRSYLKWALMWANHNDPGAHSERDQRRVTKTWLNEYFGSREYLTVKGMPVVVIWKAEHMVRDVGREGTRHLLNISREMARAAGYPGIWFVAIKFPEPDVSRKCIDRYVDLGFDMICLYHYKDDGSGGKTPKRYPFSEVAKSSRSFWEQMKMNSSLPFLIPVSTGWDDRPWLDLFEVYGRTPTIFRNICREAKAFADESGVKDILLGPLNEWGEGSYVEPNEEYGFAMYEAVRETFAERPKAGWPINQKPSDLGLGPYGLPDYQVPRIGNVDFRSGKAEGWRLQMGCRMELKFLPDGMAFKTSTRDPALAWDVAPFKAEGIRSIVVRIRTTSECGKAQLFWTHEGEKANEAASVRVPVLADGKFHDLVFDVEKNKEWTGEISSLRFDPGETPDVVLQIQSVTVNWKE